jgi:hypothetical protein
MSERDQGPSGKTSVSHGEEFRKQAQACCRFAAKTPKPEDRAFWLGLADYWLSIAPRVDEPTARRVTIKGPILPPTSEFVRLPRNQRSTWELQLGDLVPNKNN